MKKQEIKISMDEPMEKQSTEHQIDAARGVPLEQGSGKEKQANNTDSSESERLDERIRKAGI